MIPTAEFVERRGNKCNAQLVFFFFFRVFRAAKSVLAYFFFTETYIFSDTYQKKCFYLHCGSSRKIRGRAGRSNF